jgi:uncharacterized protein YjbJ (UPF0337 family)
MDNKSDRMRNELAGSWHVMTGQAQMLAGDMGDDPDRYFNGLVTALQGQLEEKIGDQQAQVASDAMRSEWQGLTKETKGSILKQWGKWTNDPQALANGVVDLMQGKLDRYQASDMRDANSSTAGTAASLTEDAADQARQSLASLFADRVS